MSGQPPIVLIDGRCLPDWLEMLPCRRLASSPPPFLQYGPQGLEYVPAPPLKSIRVDFLSGKAQAALRSPPGASSPLGKALGHDRGWRRIVDGTAGWGDDLWLFSSMGWAVCGIERDPLVYSLLRDGIRRMTEVIPQNRMDLYLGDSVLLLPMIQAEFKAEVIFFDFMFDSSKKSKSRKTIQILRELGVLPCPSEEIRLIELAMDLQPAIHRVVVKRPLHYRGQNGYRPDITFRGNSIRYDVFTRKGN